MTMLTRLIYKSIRNRPGRAVLVIIAVVVGVSLEASLINLTMAVEGNSSEELRAYGANVVMLPKNGSSLALDEPVLQPGQYIPERQLAALADPGLAIAGQAPFLYDLAEIGGNEVVMAGTRFEDAREISPWWQIEGAVPVRGDRENAVLGMELAERLGLAPGDHISLAVAGGSRELLVSGILSTGTSEDNQVLLDLDLAQEITGRPGQLSLVQVSVMTETIPARETAAALEQRMPAAIAKTVDQVVEAEKNVLDKIKLLMGLVTVLILFVSGLTVSASMTNAVLERRRDIGLMRSLGAGGKSIAVIIVGEILVLGLAAGLAGYLLGLLISQLIGMNVFDTTIPPHPLAIPASLITALLLSFLAALAPVGRALRIEPVIILRGE